MSAIAHTRPAEPVSPYVSHRVKPVQALLAIARLIKDPQDTRQVSLMEMALAGRSQLKVYERFIAQPAGLTILREKRVLAQTLDNHDYLRSLPENSFGRHYLAFAEQEGLSAQGLRDATPETTKKLAELPQDLAVFYDYAIRDIHDLYHVLCGYGRDELGEICTLAMSYQQLKIRAYRIIFTIGPFVVRRKYFRRLGVDTHGVSAAVREAKRIGRQAYWLPGQDIEAALAEDIGTLRARLNISSPVAYNAVLARIREKTGWTRGPFSALLA